MDARYSPPRMRSAWLAIPALGVLLAAPALSLGLSPLDDPMHKAHFATRLAGGAGGHWLDMFAWAQGDPALTLKLRYLGFVSWWTAPDVKLHFFRPLTALTHYADYVIWPNAFWAMHLQSLLWYGLCCLFVTRVCMRLAASRTAALLGSLLYAIDDAHIEPAAWLANRNSVVGACFAFAALLSHDRWRRDGSRIHAYLAPLLLLLALLSSEASIAILAYLLAYTLYVERSGVGTRVLSLLPPALVSLLWLSGYAALGFGTRGSGLYIDPLREGAAFWPQLPGRMYEYLMYQLAGPIALSDVVGERVVGVLTLIGVHVLLPVVGIFVIRRWDRRIALWTLAALLALIPAAAAVPHPRMLVFAGPALWMIVAEFVLAVLAALQRGALLRRGLAAAALAVLAVQHLVLAPIALALDSSRLHRPSRSLAAEVRGLGRALELPAQHLVIVNAPSMVHIAAIKDLRAQQGLTVPARMTVLGVTPHEVHVMRDGPSSFVLYTPLGYLLDALAASGRGPSRPLRGGERVHVLGYDVEVLRVSPDGRPLEVRFVFDRPLEDRSLRFAAWQHRTCRSYRFGAIGSRQVLRASYDPAPNGVAR